MNTPRKLASRKKWIRRIHLILGGISAIPLIVLAITGMMLVFPLELQLWLSGATYADVTGDQLLQPEELIAAVESKIDTEELGNVIGISYPQTSGLLAAPGGAGFARTDNRAFLFIDPYSGDVLYKWALEPGLSLDGAIFLALFLHTSLMMGEIGGWIIGISSFVLVGMCFTGIYIWWPRGRWGRHYFLINLRQGWKRANFDIHRAIGFYSLIVLLLLAITGATMSFPKMMRPIAHWITWSEPMPERPKSVEVSDVMSERISVKKLAAVAQAEFPNAVILNLNFPPKPPDPKEGGKAKPEQPWSARLISENGSERDAINLTIHPYSGEILHEDSPRTASRGDKLLRWIGPLHFGTFGGMTTRILYLILAASPVFLAFTGTLLWWNRRSKQRKAQKALQNKINKPAADSPTSTGMHL